MSFPSGWTKRLPLTVPAAKVSGTGALSDCLVPLTETNLPASVVTHAQSGGEDIRASLNSDGSGQLPCHVRLFGSSVMIVVKAPLDGASDVTFYLWYGNSGASAPAAADAYGRDAVYDFLDVYSPDLASDHAGNVTLGTAGTPTTTADELGHANQAVLFDSSATDQVYADLAAALTRPYTIGVRAKVDSTDKVRLAGVADPAQTKQQLNLATQFDSSNGLHVYSDDGSGVYSSAITAEATVGSWRDYVGVVKADGTMDIYLNGTANTLTVSVQNPSNLTRLSFATSGDSTPYGFQPITLSEGFLAAGALSADWIQTRHAAWSDPDGFVSAGSEEDVSASTQSFCGVEVSSINGADITSLNGG